MSGGYRKALPFDVAKTEIQRMAGIQFDPIAVDTFLREEDALREMTAMEFPSASKEAMSTTTG